MAYRTERCAIKGQWRSIVLSCAKFAVIATAISVEVLFIGAVATGIPDNLGITDVLNAAGDRELSRLCTALSEGSGHSSFGASGNNFIPRLGENSIEELRTRLQSSAGAVARA